MFLRDMLMKKMENSCTNYYFFFFCRILMMIRRGHLPSLICQKLPIFKCNVKKLPFESMWILIGHFLEWFFPKAIFLTQVVFTYNPDKELLPLYLKFNSTNVEWPVQVCLNYCNWNLFIFATSDDFSYYLY